MEEFEQKIAHVNGIDLAYAERGEGPLVLLLHGFPDLGRGWRHQLDALAAAGYRAVAPDLRGYGASTSPRAVDQHTYFHHIGDLVALMDHLGHDRAAVAGHDMGSYVAWHMALVVPERVAAVAGLSVALRARSPEPPLTILRRAFGDGFYQQRFQVPDVPEADLDANIETFLPGILVGLSADAETPVDSLVLAEDQSFSDLFPAPARLPAWLDAAEVDTYINAFRATGFTGPLNWYRNTDRNWELLAPWASACVRPPAMYVAGAEDIAYKIAQAGGALESMPAAVADLREVVVLPDCGHWLMLEAPDAVNAALLRLLDQAAF